MSDTNRTYHAGANNDITTKKNHALTYPEVCFSLFYKIKIIFGNYETDWRDPQTQIIKKNTFQIKH